MTKITDITCLIKRRVWRY